MKRYVLLMGAMLVFGSLSVSAAKVPASQEVKFKFSAYNDQACEKNAGLNEQLVQAYAKANNLRVISLKCGKDKKVKVRAMPIPTAPVTLGGSPSGPKPPNLAPITIGH